jgi:hypothetical protein
MNIITYNRNFCVLCNNNFKLLDIKTLKMPLYSIYPNNIKKETYWNMTYGYCEKCFSVQLKSLLDLNLLYNKNYILPNFNSYNIIQHNISFIKFIIDSIETNQSLIEIGGSSFILGKHLIEYYKDYTIFDYYLDHAVEYNNVKYIQGNCEIYNFNENSNIIMSHVFEHLYEPKKFIENCKKNRVKNIIISIPNMNNLNNIYVFNQHTFLYNDNDIEYIFGLSNYKVKNKIFFNIIDESAPCLFFHFELTNNIINIERKIILDRHNYTQKILSPIIIPKNTFLITAGSMMLYIYSLIENKDNIIGIIDNNKLIQGNKFADLDYIIQSYEYLKNYDNNTNCLVFGYRKNDIINNIKKINTIINIIIIE